MRTTTAALCLFLVAVACGGDEAVPVTTTPAAATALPPSSFQGYVASVMATEGAADEIDIDATAGACIAARTFDAIGEDRFLEIGFDPAILPPPPIATFDDAWTDREWQLIIDAVFACIDVEALFVETLVDEGMNTEVAACLGARYNTEGYLRTGLGTRGELSNEEIEAIAALSVLFEECAAAG